MSLAKVTFIKSVKLRRYGLCGCVAACCHAIQPLKMSTRDFSWCKGGQCVRLTTYHPRSAESQENLGPYPARNP
jgi:hypothetical protein